ncbi:terminase small subunit [Azospirillum sp. Vi22]|uniref:terminase small subunit n=1 Tax=Azospirillum baldaniorum TaxID=1064539 RepID=UPI00157B6894|nr:terminase small subunit [Azospirillum baldaniorum]NUB07022.1 terminase small subunit [Azospirillum baldaniorum]
MTDRDWKAIRAAYEAGAGPRELARRYGGSPGTYTKRAAAEGWPKPAETETGNGKRKAVSVSKGEGGKAKRKGRGASQREEAPPPPADPEGLDELNPRQRQFVREYGRDFNGTRAAIRAGYSPASAAQQASDLLRHPKVSLAIAEAERLRAERTNITADRVRLELARMGLADLSDLAEWDAGTVRLRSSSELPPDLSAAVVEVSEGKEGVKIKLGKMQALRELARATGLTAQRPNGGDGADPVTKVERTVVRPPDPHG